MCERINKIAVTISAAWLLAGGSTLAPERTAAENLMGKISMKPTGFSVIHCLLVQKQV